MLAEQVLDIVEQVAKPVSSSESEVGDIDSTPVVDRDTLALAKLRIDVRKWLIERAEEASPAAPWNAESTEDRAALAAEALRDLLAVLDGRGRGLPDGQTLNGREAQERLPDPVGTARDASAENGEPLRGTQPNQGKQPTLGAAPSDGTVPSEGTPLPAGLFLKSRNKAESGADGGSREDGDG